MPVVNINLELGSEQRALVALLAQGIYLISLLAAYRRIRSSFTHLQPGAAAGGFPIRNRKRTLVVR